MLAFLSSLRCCAEVVVEVKARTRCAGLNTCRRKPGGSKTICSSWFILVLWPQFSSAAVASLRSGSTRRTRPAEQRSLEWKRYFEYQTMNLRRDAELASARPSLQQHLRVARALKWHFQLGSIGPLPPDFRQILPPGWSRAIAIIRVTGFHTVAPAVRRNHTRGQRQAMQLHVCCALTVRSRDGVTCSVAKIVITLPFNHMCILCVYVSSHFFLSVFGHVLPDHGSVSAAVTRRSSNYLIVEATSFFDLWSGIGGWPDLMRSPHSWKYKPELCGNSPIISLFGRGSRRRWRRASQIAAVEAFT